MCTSDQMLPHSQHENYSNQDLCDHKVLLKYIVNDTNLHDNTLTFKLYGSKAAMIKRCRGNPQKNCITHTVSACASTFNDLRFIRWFVYLCSKQSSQIINYSSLLNMTARVHISVVHVESFITCLEVNAVYQRSSCRSIFVAAELSLSCVGKKLKILYKKSL